MCEELKKKIDELKKGIEKKEKHINGIQSNLKIVRDNWHSLKKKGGRFDPEISIERLKGQETYHQRELSNLEDELAAREEELRALRCQDS